MFGRSLETLSLPAVPGDVRRTGADCSLAREDLGFSPATLLEDGLQNQFDEARRLGRRALRRARRWFTPPGDG
jgi:nucleoside-diphosphate-sugar epimerase